MYQMRLATITGADTHATHTRLSNKLYRPLLKGIVKCITIRQLDQYVTDKALKYLCMGESPTLSAKVCIIRCLFFKGGVWSLFVVKSHPVFDHPFGLEAIQQFMKIYGFLVSGV